MHVTVRVQYTCRFSLIRIMHTASSQDTHLLSGWNNGCTQHVLYSAPVMLVLVLVLVLSGEATGGFGGFKPPTFLQGHSCDLHRIDEKNFAVVGGYLVSCHVSQ